MVGNRKVEAMAGVRDRVGGLLADDGGDAAWGDRVDELLYDGEALAETVSVGDARVVVTSHRVLAFTPAGDGPNFRQVDRPNVVGVSSGSVGEPAHLLRGIRWTAIGLVLVLAGVFVDTDAIVGDVDLGTGGGQIGVGGVLGVVRSMLDLLGRLDDLLVTVGALAMLLGVAVLGVYLWTRDPALVVEVAGDADDVHLPRPADPRPVVERLEAAIRPGTVEPSAEAGDPLRDPDHQGKA